MPFLLQHGWGFAADCWRGWLTRLPGTVLLADRGYWHTPAQPATPPPGLVVICHSLGLHLLGPDLLAQARLLVIVSGFAHFHGVTPADGRFSRRHVQRMAARLGTDPRALLRDFYRDCDCAHWPLPSQDPNITLLAQDLTLLDQGHWHWPASATPPPTLILHGRHDKIVRPQRAEELADLLPGSHVVLIDQAGHGLPFTHADTCMKHILTSLGGR